jgi:hypothetical protein
MSVEGYSHVSSLWIRDVAFRLSADWMIVILQESGVIHIVVGL